MLELRRGDTNPISIVVSRPRIDSLTGEPARDARGKVIKDPVDLTGATIKFTARDRKKAAVITLDSTTGGVTMSAPLSDGRAVATVTPVMTETLTVPMYLKYDLQLIEANGVKTTISKGDALVWEDITRG